MNGQIMWLLLIVLFAPQSEIRMQTVLNVFEPYEACQPKRHRVGFEMAENYPNKSDFRVVFEFQEKKPTQRPGRRESEQPASLAKVQL